MRGETTPIMLIVSRVAACTHKLHIQVHEVVMEIPVERMDKGKISLGRTNKSAWSKFATRLTPTDGSPRVGKVDVVNVHKRNRSVTGHLVRLPVIAVSGNERANDNQRNATSNSSGHQKRPASNAVEENDSRDRKDSVDNAVNTSREQRCCVRVESKLSKN